MAEAMNTRSYLIAPPPWVAHAWQYDNGVRTTLALADAVRAQTIVPEIPGRPCS